MLESLLTVPDLIALTLEFTCFCCFFMFFFFSLFRYQLICSIVSFRTTELPHSFRTTSVCLIISYSITSRTVTVNVLHLEP